MPGAGTTVNINTGLGNVPVITTAGQQAFSVTLGSNAGQTGALSIDGGALTVDNAAANPAVSVGDQGTGQLTISNGGVLTSSWSYVALNLGSTGTATVTGAGSRWNVTQWLDVGSSGNGTLNVEAGGVVSFNVGGRTALFGSDAGAVGRLVVTGSGSQFIAQNTTFGNNAAGQGHAEISDNGLFNGGNTTVGSLGVGSMLFETGGDGAVSTLTIGGNAAGTVTVDGAGTTLAATGTVRVGSSSSGDLTVQNGGVVTSASGAIGTFNGSSGAVTVTGADSRWTITNTLQISQTGSTGTGTLDILTGGVVSAASFTALNGAQVAVDGTNSRLTLTGSMNFGSTTSPGGSLTISNGGVVSASSLTGNSSMTVDLDGTGSQLNLLGGTSTSTTFTLGGSGAGNTLDITGGADMSTQRASLSTVASSGVVVNVSGAGSTWTATGITLGGAGTSTMTVDAAASVSVDGELIVDGTAATSLTISNGAHVTQSPSASGSGQFRLGVDGSGTLLVESGGILETLGHPTFVTFTFLARNAGSTAKATITGAGSQWISHGSVTIGSEGTATLDILDGATVTGDQGGDIGFLPGSSGTVTVDGPGSKWTLAQPPPLAGISNISVGIGGTGIMHVSNGAYVQAQGIGVGSAFYDFLGGTGLNPGNGTLVVTGAGTKVDLDVGTFQSFDAGGDGGTGVIQVLDGAVVTVVGQGHFGQSSIYSGAPQPQLLGHGTLTVDGAGSRVTYTQTLDIGEQGTGVLIVSNGGFVSNSDGYLGSFTNSVGSAGDGTATVTGASSIWQNNGFLRVGDQGSGELNVLAGGLVTNTDAVIANETNSSGSATVSGAGSTWTSSGTLAVGNLGTATLTIADGGTVNAGAVSINNLSTLNIGNGGAAGAINAPSIVDDGVLRFDHTDTVTFTVPVSGTGSLVKAGSGELVLPDTNIFTYTGATDVTGGMLSVDGDISSSSLLTVGTGGTLGGSGTVGTTIVGGRLAPGNSIGTLAVSGNLTLASGSTYAVEVDAVSADRTNVAGTADLSGGTVATTYATASYIQKTYTILTAQGGLGGTTFAGLTGTAPTGFTQKLAYDGSNAYLVLDLLMREPEPGAPSTPTEPGTPQQPGTPQEPEQPEEPGQPEQPGQPEEPNQPEEPGSGGSIYDNLNRNQRSVANAIVGYFDANGGVPTEFAALDPDGLTLVSGEATAGAIGAGIRNADLFLDLLGDQALAGRGSIDSESSDPAAFVAEDKATSGDRFAALAMQAKHAADPVARAFESRWQGWGGVYAGSAAIDGDAAQGSHDTDLGTFGIAGGISRRWEDTVVGLALGGGYSSFDLSDGLGSGHANIFNAGMFARHDIGPAYISGAAAYGYNDVELSRTIAPDALNGEFEAHSFSGRLEAGYEIATPAATITPYAAFQAIAYRLPGYAETGTGSFLLTYEGDTTTVTRGEFGARLEHLIGLDSGATLKLSGRAALAINGGDDIGFVAGFQSLPGTSFTILGAEPDRYGALIEAGAEYRTRSGFFAVLAFQGEFSGNVTGIAGNARIGFEW